jgi:hypothetical protein
MFFIPSLQPGHFGRPADAPPIAIMRRFARRENRVRR